MEPTSSKALADKDNNPSSLLSAGPPVGQSVGPSSQSSSQAGVGTHSATNPSSSSVAEPPRTNHGTLVDSTEGVGFGYQNVEPTSKESVANDDGDDDEDGINVPPPDSEEEEEQEPQPTDKTSTGKTKKLPPPPAGKNCNPKRKRTRNKQHKLKKVAGGLASKRAKVDCGAFPVNRQEVRAAGVSIPVSWGDTCMPDALVTIVTSIMEKAGLKFIQLSDGTKVTLKGLEKYFRESLAPNGEWVTMESMESFVSSIGFKASLVTGPDRCSKIAVLTRDTGHFLIICKLTYTS